MALTTGQVTVGTTEVQVIAVSPRIDKGVTIKAMSTNAVTVFIGVTGLSVTTGFELSPGESYTFPINDDFADEEEAVFFARSGSASQKICFITF